MSTLPLGTYIGQLFVDENELVPNVGGVSARQVILTKPVQLVKALVPILVTPDGIITSDNAPQS